MNGIAHPREIFQLNLPEVEHLALLPNKTVTTIYTLTSPLYNETFT